MSTGADERDMARLEMQSQRNEALEHLKAQVEVAKLLIQSLILINGGAIVALFTLMGGEKVAMKFDPAAMKAAFACFVSGLLAAIACGVFGYLSQLCFQLTSTIEAWQFQAIATGTDKVEADSTKLYRVGWVMLGLALLAAVCSMVCFGMGSWEALTGSLAK